MAKRTDEYSVWNPPTSSCSPSVRSKGGWLSSAVTATANSGKGRMPRRKMFQWKKLSAWESTIARVDSEWVTMTTMAMVRPMAAS